MGKWASGIGVIILATGCGGESVDENAVSGSNQQQVGLSVATLHGFHDDRGTTSESDDVGLVVWKHVDGMLQLAMNSMRLRPNSTPKCDTL